MLPSPRKMQLSSFDPSVGFDRERSLVVFATWYIFKVLFFLSPMPWPSPFKAFLLRAYGAKAGNSIVIKPRVNIHFPWKLSLGDNVWIGEEACILNFAHIRIGSNVCISQQAFLCSGSHDFRDPSFSYRNLPIQIGDGVWLQARVFVCPGVSIGDDSVVCANSFVQKDVLCNQVSTGNPARCIGYRWKDSP
jgi:putative colanic acid biosynthesis acetyltransferase WcaF